MFHFDFIKQKIIFIYKNKSGSPGRTRTSDRTVNSRLLYQLSYRGTELKLVQLYRDIGYIRGDKKVQVEIAGLEATPGIEPGYTALQAAASPLRHVADFQKGRCYVAQTGQLVQTFFLGRLCPEYLPLI